MCCLLSAPNVVARTILATNDVMQPSQPTKIPVMQGLSMVLTGHLSNPPEPLADLLSFFELIHEEPKKNRKT
jgi:hypothetical protein